MGSLRGWDEIVIDPHTGRRDHEQSAALVESSVTIGSTWIPVPSAMT
jgi:hypothetical protein